MFSGIQEILVLVIIILGILFLPRILEQRAGKKTGCAQAGYCGFRKNAAGYCRLCFVAGGDGSFYTTLDKRPYPVISFSESAR